MNQLPGADPLQQLRDIHLPDPVSWWPPAPGWWILAALVLGLLIFLLVRWQIRQRRRKYRREALQILTELQSAYRTDGDNRKYLRELLRLLRRLVKTAYPELRWESLTSSQLIQQLNLEMQEDIDLDALLYKDTSEPSIDSRHLDSFATSLGRWIQQHRVTD